MRCKQKITFVTTKANAVTDIMTVVYFFVMVCCSYTFDSECDIFDRVVIMYSRLDHSDSSPLSRAATQALYQAVSSGLETRWELWNWIGCAAVDLVLSSLRKLGLRVGSPQCTRNAFNASFYSTLCTRLGSLESSIKVE